MEALGKKLQEARLAKKITLDEAARMTKIRAARLQEIEAEDFSNFSSLAYAKGFLLIYGKFLDVDVTPYLEAFETSREVTVDGYSYLQDAPSSAPPPDRATAAGEAPGASSRSSSRSACSCSASIWSSCCSTFSASRRSRPTAPAQSPPRAHAAAFRIARRRKISSRRVPCRSKARRRSEALVGDAAATSRTRRRLLRPNRKCAGPQPVHPRRSRAAPNVATPPRANRVRNHAGAENLSAGRRSTADSKPAFDGWLDPSDRAALVSRPARDGESAGARARCKSRRTERPLADERCRCHL